MSKEHIQQRTIKSQKEIDTAAWQLFCEKGYFNTNTKEIAKLAGVSVGNFYNYYEDKMAVYYKLTYNYLNDSMKAIKELEQFIQNASDKRAAIQTYIYSQMNRATDSKRFFNDCQVLIQDHEDLNALFTQHNQTAIHFLENILKEIPGIKKRASYPIMARLIYTLVNSLSEDACSILDSATFKEYRQQLVELVQHYLFD